MKKMKTIVRLSLTQEEKDFLQKAADFFARIDELDRENDISDNILTYQPVTFEDLASLMIEIADYAETGRE